MSKVMRLREVLLLITTFFLLSLLFLSRRFITGSQKPTLLGGPPFYQTSEHTDLSVTFKVLYDQSTECHYGGVMTSWGCVCGEDTEGPQCNSTRADLGPLYTMDKKVTFTDLYVVYHRSSLDRKFDRLVNSKDGVWNPLLTYLSWGSGRRTWRSPLLFHHLQHLQHLQHLHHVDIVQKAHQESELEVQVLLSPTESVDISTTSSNSGKGNDEDKTRGPGDQQLAEWMKVREEREKSLTAADEFELHVIGQYGPWTHNDLKVLRELTLFYSFFHSNIPTSTLLREKWKTNSSSSVHQRRAKPFIIGYILLFSEAQHMKQLLMLLKMIWHADDYFVIHVDSKAASFIPQLTKDINNVLQNPKNLYIFSEIEGKWGDISLVYMEVVSWAKLFYKHQKIDYIINLSSVDYPIKNYHELQEFLYSFGRSVNIIDVSQKDVIDRFANPCFAKPSIFTLSPPQAVLATGRLWKKLGLKTFQAGSQWHILHRSFVLQLLVNPLMIEFLFSLKRVGIPDEAYIQTAASLIAKDNTENIWSTYVQWETGSHEITSDLFERIKTMKKAFFARKFLNVQRIEDIQKFLQLYPFANLTKF